MPDGVTRMAGGNLKDGLFNNSHMLLGTEGFGGGHGDMRNAGGMHKKMMHNLNKKAPKAPEGGVSYEDFLKQEAAKKITKAAKNSPALNRKKKMTGGQPAHAGKVAPMIDSGNGRKTRMVVGVRCRPLSGKERTRGSHNCIEVENGVDVYANDPDDKMGGLDYLRLNVTKDKAYTFDHAFGPESRSVDVRSCEHDRRPHCARRCARSRASPQPASSPASPFGPRLRAAGSLAVFVSLARGL